MKLTELGPRLNLELFKVESGLCEGDILYHKFQTKTPEEAERTKKRVSYPLYVFYYHYIL